jgi:hypothetical protein
MLMTKSQQETLFAGWLRTRRASHFVRILAFIFVAGAIATALGLVIAGIISGPQLAIAGNFAEGIAAFFGLAAISAALFVNYVMANRETQDAEETWTAMMRLVEALTFYMLLIQEAVRAAKADNEPLETLGHHPLVRQGRLSLKEALEKARETGLPRILSIVSGKQNITDLGLVLCCTEAFIRNEIETDNPGIGNYLFSNVEALITELEKLTYDSIAIGWAEEWLKTTKAANMANKLKL